MTNKHIQYRLVSLDDGKTLPLDLTQPVTIGRDAAWASYLATTRKDAVSRRHCQLGLHNGQPTITDLASANGTLLNGHPLPGFQSVPLHPGDDLLLGGDTDISRSLQARFIASQPQPDASSFAENPAFNPSLSPAPSQERTLQRQSRRDYALVQAGSLDDARKLLVENYNNQPAYRAELGSLLDCLDAYQDASEMAAKCIEQRFPPPQMTYNRFMGELRQLDEAFIGIISNGANVIAVATRHTGKRDQVLQRTIAQAGELADKTEELSLELLAGGTKASASTSQIDALAANMAKLIESLQHYQ
jgi:predicted component of type VI protein secretion system